MSTHFNIISHRNNRIYRYVTTMRCHRVSFFLKMYAALSAHFPLLVVVVTATAIVIYRIIYL